MQQLKRAYLPTDQIDRAVKDIMLMHSKDPEQLTRVAGLAHGAAPAEVTERLRQIVTKSHADSDIWKNDVYQVAVYRHDAPAQGWPKMIHLSIKRIDRQPVHDWRDLQEIKNQLVGPEHEAVELYPAESRKVDSANQYHLWVLADSNIKFPFGFAEGFVADKIDGTVAQQRPFEKGVS